MHKVLVNRLGGLSLPRKNVVRLTDRPDMTLDVYHGCKTTTIIKCLRCAMLADSTLTVLDLNWGLKWTSKWGQGHFNLISTMSYPTDKSMIV